MCTPSSANSATARLNAPLYLELVEADLSLLRKVVDGPELDSEQFSALMDERREIVERLNAHSLLVAAEPAIATGYELNNFFRYVAFADRKLSDLATIDETPLTRFLGALNFRIESVRLSTAEQRCTHAVLRQIGRPEWFDIFDESGALRASTTRALLVHVASVLKEELPPEHPEIRLRSLAWEVVLRAIYLEARARGFSHAELCT